MKNTSAEKMKPHLDNDLLATEDQQSRRTVEPESDIMYIQAERSSEGPPSPAPSSTMSVNGSGTVMAAAEGGGSITLNGKPRPKYKYAPRKFTTETIERRKSHDLPEVRNNLNKRMKMRIEFKEAMRHKRYSAQVSLSSPLDVTINTNSKKSTSTPRPNINTADLNSSVGLLSVSSPLMSPCSSTTEWAIAHQLMMQEMSELYQTDLTQVLQAGMHQPLGTQFSYVGRKYSFHEVEPQVLMESNLAPSQQQPKVVSLLMHDENWYDNDVSGNSALESLFIPATQQGFWPGVLLHDMGHLSDSIEQKI